jgi:hypothetical protein
MTGKMKRGGNEGKSMEKKKKKKKKKKGESLFCFGGYFFLRFH